MTTTDAPSVVGEATVGELQAAVRGQVIRPGDSDYDEARAVWNAAHDKHPALIVRCSGTADVIKAVEFARSQGLAARGTRRRAQHRRVLHLRRWGGSRPLADEGRQRSTRTDRRAVAQGGATWADFDHETQAFGLAVTGGLVSTTGLGGFTLGGGIGWLLRKHGLTCDNLVSADVVTRRRAPRPCQRRAEQRPVLGDCAVAAATSASPPSLEYALHPVGPTVLGGLVFFPGEAARDVLIGWRELTASMPDELTSLVVLTTAPPVPFLPESVHGTPIVAIGAMYCGPLDVGEDVVRAAAHARRADRRSHGTRPVRRDAADARPAVAGRRAQLLHLRDDGQPSRRRGRRAHRQVVGQADAAERDPHPPRRRRHGTRPAGGNGVRAAHLAVSAQRHRPVGRRRGLRRRRDLGQGRPRRARRVRTRTRCMSTSPARRGADKVRASYPPQTYAKLVAIKKRYDPTNLFRLNQNITPMSDDRQGE